MDSTQQLIQKQEQQIKLAQILNNIHLDITHLLKTYETTLSDLLYLYHQGTHTENSLETDDRVSEIVYHIDTLVSRYNIPLESIIELYFRVNKTKTAEKHILPRKKQYTKDGHIHNRKDKDGLNPCGCGSHSYHYEYDQLEKDVYGVCNDCGEDIYIVIPEKKAKVIREGKWN